MRLVKHNGPLYGRVPCSPGVSRAPRGGATVGSGSGLLDQPSASGTCRHKAEAGHSLGSWGWRGVPGCRGQRARMIIIMAPVVPPSTRGDAQVKSGQQPWQEAGTPLSRPGPSTHGRACALRGLQHVLLSQSLRGVPGLLRTAMPGGPGKRRHPLHWL